MKAGIKGGIAEIGNLLRSNSAEAVLNFGKLLPHSASSLCYCIKTEDKDISIASSPHIVII